MAMNVQQCEWVADGWPHRQCEKRGTTLVGSSYSVFPDHYYCARHAHIMELGRCDDCYALRGEGHSERIEH
jgi:hypothetical protein